MFANIYIKRLIVTLRSKDMIIWIVAFPMMLATLFFFAFGSLDESDQFHAIPVAVVDDAAYRDDAAFGAVMQEVSKGEDALLTLTLVSSSGEAENLLKDGKVDGYIQISGSASVTVKDDGLNQTILKSFLDEYLQTQSTIQTIMQKDPAALQSLAEHLKSESFTEEISLSGNPATQTVTYYYALLAMICMYGGFQGLITVSYMQPNLSPLGARRSMAPINRFLLVGADLLGGLTIHLAGLFIIVAYMIFALKVDFGGKLLPMLLTCISGSLVGVSFGAVISVSSKIKEAVKMAALISVTMVCCFFADLMTSGISYLVAQKAPLLSWINPAARITDAFYCLYYYDSYGRFFLNIAILLGISLLFFVITALFVRRQRYESI